MLVIIPIAVNVSRHIIRTKIINLIFQTQLGEGGGEIVAK